MQIAEETRDISIRYTLALQDGTPLTRNTGVGRLDYTNGAGQIFAAVEEALHGAVKGDKREIVLSPVHDPGLKLDATRLALLLGHPGQTLILSVEIL